MEWLLFLLFGAGAVVFSVSFQKHKKEGSQKMTKSSFDEETKVTEVKLNSELEKAINVTAYYVYLKKHCYSDLSQDERMQDLGKWTLYQHETFKLETPYTRAAVTAEIKKRLNLTDDDVKVVGKADLWVPIKF